MHDLLTEAGLTELQAAAYLFLLEHGDSTPPTLTKQLNITRTNSYKVLDSLQELGLAIKLEVRKKFVYRPADPAALASLVAHKRNNVIALEKHVNAAMQELRKTYKKSSGGKTSSTITHGKKAMVAAYEQQARTQQPIYFIKARADIPFLGFEAMDNIRTLPAKNGTTRFGITPDGHESSAKPEIDQNSNLTRTWLDNEAYTAPVEWAVSGNQILIQVFSDAGRTIIIEDKQVAESFQQLWKVIDVSLRANPAYSQLPKRAARQV